MPPQPQKGESIPRPDMTRPQFYRTFAVDEGDEIVISGMSGRFPNSRNVAEFGEKLFNKVDMLEDSENRWLNLNNEVPKRCGRVHDIDKFDASFFGVHHMQAHSMDPQCRTILEEAYMAVMDAGVNPNSLRNTRTGVYVASCFSDSDKEIIIDSDAQSAFSITGTSRAMYANRISYALGLKGPSFLLDTACSSSIYAIDVAYAALRSGDIDAAIVGGANLILHPNVTLCFARLGVLSKDAVCSPFDASANGYVRSEGVAAIFLQRRRNARRVYATLVHSKTNCDGFKAEGITYPSGNVQEELFNDFYRDVNIPADSIGYMEAHSTGTVAGDPEECRAIDNALCKHRSEPLLVGSVKSNIGHTEPTSGICSVVKAALIFESGKIPPNINFKSPRKEITALMEGRMKVVDEITDLKEPYIGVNSFGFGGANGHILLKRHEKKKTQGGVPEGSLPVLCMWAGRTKESVETVFKKVESQPLDPEYIALLHSVQDGGIPGMLFRGYNILEGSGTKKPTSFTKEVEYYTGIKRPIVWVFSGMGSQWAGMGKALMAIPLFKESIQRCHKALKPVGLDLVKILTSDDPTTFDNIMHSFVGIAATQIALTDILRALDMQPDYIIGHSTGELGCAYADGCFTAEQMILAAYYRGKVSLETEKIRGSMAAIGLSYKAIRAILPDTIEVACHNGPDSCTISGPADDIARFVAHLKEQQIFAKEVPCSNIAYHTRYIAHMGEGFLKYLRQIIPHPKKRSSKWLSTSVPQTHWSRPESLLSSAEYHTNNLLSSVLFEETSTLLPSNALLVEIAPHALLQSILKTSVPKGVYVGLTKRNDKNNHMQLLAALGKLYIQGLNVPIGRLYPKVEWPVSRGTETISDAIEWDHRDKWDVFSYNKFIFKKTGEKTFIVDMKSDQFKYLNGHNIDGKILVPATFYLECVWITFSGMKHDVNYTDRPIEMENVKFLRATTLTMDSRVELLVMIHYGTGNFEIIEGDSLLVSGVIRDLKDAKKPNDIAIEQFDTTNSNEFSLSAKDFYKELKLCGYYYSGAFKAVESVRGDAQFARLKWKENWVTFLDCMLQTQIVRKDSRDLCLPTKINNIRIFSKHHLATVTNDQCVDVHFDKLKNRVASGGVEITGLEISTVQRRKPPGLPVLERYQFIPHFPSPPLAVEDIGRFVIQLALENDAMSKLSIVEVIREDGLRPIIEHFANAIDDLPLITGDFRVLSSTKYENIPESITVEDGDISVCRDANIIIDQTDGDQLFKQAATLMEKSYLALVTKAENNPSIPGELSLLAVCPCVGSDFKIMLLRKSDKSRPCAVDYLKISSSDKEFQWLKTAQDVLSAKDLIVVSENDKHNGVLGLTNCLRKEYTKTVARCILIDDPTAPAFDPQNPFYAPQLDLGMAINIYRKGQWGTYRHLKLKANYPVSPYNGHMYANILHRGDMSSLKWLQGRQGVKESKIKVIYASLNFRDVMLATGRISADIFGEGRLAQDCVLGMEFAGIDTATGKRIMGMVPRAAVSNYVEQSTGVTMQVPSKWSLREAATVPVVYFTVYYAFFIRTDIRNGKSILIHAGTGGIGLSAIRVALAYGLEVFTTASTAEKRDYLLQVFPQLKANHIGNSRDTTFLDMVQRETNGEGVDFVLNSLSEEKLLASVKCLGRGGVFLEIGKFDLASDNPLGMAPFLKELSFVAVLLDLLITQNDTKVKQRLCDIVQRDIASGVIQPLPSTVFRANELEPAFRFLASGKHIGKVLIQVSESAESKSTLPVQVLPTLNFLPELSYVIAGGLGGFGLELVDWMILRGARKVVLSSSRGISNGYQLLRMKTWRSYGCEVRISTAKIATRNGCEALLREATILGPVGGIFNLAVVLKDALFANQSVDLFKQSFEPKASATLYLDELSRKLCPKLEHFVIFSSVSCGRGNAGQANYGMANSIMERIIEDRVAGGLPGKAIQWGAIGEVGLVAAMAEDKIDLEIGGTMQQRISSCLRELDTLLSCPDPLIASMVVAEKRISQSSSVSLLETVMNIMNIRDAKSVSHGFSLSELGMDSLMAVDIKQTLERDFDLFLSPQDLRSLTFEKLQEYSQTRQKHVDEAGKPEDESLTEKISNMVRSLGDEMNCDKIIVPINEVKTGKGPVFVFTGIESSSGPAWIDLGKTIKAPSYVIQLSKTSKMSSYDEIAEFALKQITAILKPNEDFRIVGYSYGSIIVAKVVHLLEELGHKGKVVLIDGSPSIIAEFYRSCEQIVGPQNVDALILSSIVSFVLPSEPEENTRRSFLSITSLEGRLNASQKFISRQKFFSPSYMMAQTEAILQRCRLAQQMDLSTFKRFNSPICLVRPTIPILTNMPKDYDLQLLTSSKLTIHTLEGNHTTVLQSPELPGILNNFLLM